MLALETIQAMPADDVRRALAERLGWTRRERTNYSMCSLWGWDSPEGVWYKAPPDYPNDANEWCNLMCRVNAGSDDEWLAIHANYIEIKLHDFFESEIFFHQNTPESIGLAVCRAALWAMQEEWK